ncbi:Hypothetical protein NTJ_09886 [Nesidiocoris tenuis]|uniref:Uncharacterized protein n=1 Tax=Nesidiocoris tenuis TaxID=355587 RepID=A0ABN7AYL7_9HEMI|nr:Hypothetical protein NTJ_09886 [Nesidiocoris tenuis]
MKRTGGGPKKHDPRNGSEEAMKTGINERRPRIVANHLEAPLMGWKRCSAISGLMIIINGSDDGRTNKNDQPGKERTFLFRSSVHQECTINFDCSPLTPAS